MITRPDYSHWLQKPGWRLDDAVIMVLGIDPGSYPYPRIRPRLGSLRMRCSPPNVFWNYLDAAMKSEGRDFDVLEYSSESVSGTSYAKVEPIKFVKWADKRGINVPGELLKLLEYSDTDVADEMKGNGKEEKKIIMIQTPERKDDWFDVIRDGAVAYENKHGCTSSQIQLWSWLVSNPPAEYSIHYDESKKVLKMPGGNTLGRENFNKRYDRYYPLSTDNGADKG